jgi:Zn-dependent protease with chaperone function
MFEKEQGNGAAREPVRAPAAIEKPLKAAPATAREPHLLGTRSLPLGFRNLENDVALRSAAQRELAQSEIHQREVAPPGEAPNREHPTTSTAFRWLGFGVGGAATTSIAAAVGIASITGSWLVASGSWLAIAGTALVAAEKVAQTLIKRRYGGGAIEDNCAEPSEGDRVAKAVEALCARAGVAAPRLVARKEHDSAAMFDGPGAQNVLVYSPKFTKTLSDRQLEAVVAHEISHIDKPANVAMVAFRCAAKVAEATTLTGTFFLCQSAGHNWGVSGLLAAGSCALAMLAQKGVWNIASRANELRTDIRAVELTGDLGSFVDMLKVAHGMKDGEAPKASGLLRMIPRSHPHVEDRERWLRRACGNLPESQAHA